MTDGYHIVVLDGGYAGLTAAARIAEAHSSAVVTLVDRKAVFVEHIRLHEIAAGSEPRDLGYSTFMQSRGGAFVQGNVSAMCWLSAKKVVPSTCYERKSVSRKTI